MVRVASIQVGKPKEMEPENSPGKPWRSGFVKEAVSEPLWLGTTNLEGDGQADLDYHGGPSKAVCVYPLAHYPYWRETLDMPDLTGGDFGENFTVADLTEDEICIGDDWTIGEATVQVSQPRQPCWKLARRWSIQDLALQVQQTGRTGWYFRVLVEGYVQRGMPLKLIKRPEPNWTIANANRLLHHDKANRTDAAQLAAVASLSPSWRATLAKRAELNIQPNEQQRLKGNE
ncbi:MOSC domain-containing protein [Aporhodopirellula aestuarii]|uniref:MOSC domain-containing protein n=1 Tax=Aporhodopirellula aestuarii TaxID=2950107 RepID=A0ABT0TY18_9BACT|nr:MOSC domain-containing protein [Aporhodopirellula aestuarii]MCM2369480.1 MOSC domain-containing protein [Aporhodopirellula aestuarii]